MTDTAQDHGRWHGQDGEGEPHASPSKVPIGAASKRPILKVGVGALAFVAIFVGLPLSLIGTASTTSSHSLTTTKVVYTVSGTGTASSITYDTLKAASGRDVRKATYGAALPWQVTAHATGGVLGYSVIAQSATSTTITCSISVNGNQLARRTSAGQPAVVSCSAYTPPT